ncbi:membrane hypothetical protein [Candidatus Magnetomoraceae bacterium gMMP-1]
MNDNSELHTSSQDSVFIKYIISLIFLCNFCIGVFFSWKPWYGVPAYAPVYKLREEIIVIAYSPCNLIILHGLVITFLCIIGLLCLLFKGIKNKGIIYSAWAILFFALCFPISVPLLAPKANFLANCFYLENETISDFLIDTGVTTHIPWNEALKPVNYQSINYNDHDSFKVYLDDINDYLKLDFVDTLYKTGFSSVFYHFIKKEYFIVILCFFLTILTYYLTHKNQIPSLLQRDFIFVLFILILIISIVCYFYIKGNYHYYTARNNQMMGLYNKALKHYNLAFNILPCLKNNLSTQFYLGKIYYKMKKLNSGYYWLFKGIKNLEEGQLKKAFINLNQCLIYMPDNLLAHYLIYRFYCQYGVMAYNMKQYHEAIFLFKYAMNHISFGVVSRFNLGLTLNKIGNYKKAEYYLKEFNSLFKLMVRPSEIAYCRANFLMAWSAMQRRKLSEALAYYREGLTLPNKKIWYNVFTPSARFCNYFNSYLMPSFSPQMESK